MGSITSGVYPVFENMFKIGKLGTSSTAQDMISIADLETFQIGMDNNIEEWTPLDQQGYGNRMQTGKGFSISLNGKRRRGDAGNDYVAGLLFKSGKEVESKFEWTFPDGTKAEFGCIVSVSNVGGGDSTNVGALEFEILSNGKPTVTAPVKAPGVV